MTVYINSKKSGRVETIDQFDTYREAREMLKEYRMCFHWGNYYLSSRSTREWRESGVTSKEEYVRLSQNGLTTKE